MSYTELLSYKIHQVNFKFKIILKTLKALSKGYIEFKVIAEPHRERTFRFYEEAEAAYLRSLYRRDDKSELWARKIFQDWVNLTKE